MGREIECLGVWVGGVLRACRCEFLGGWVFGVLKVFIFEDFGGSGDPGFWGLGV